MYFSLFSQLKLRLSGEQPKQQILHIGDDTDVFLS